MGMVEGNPGRGNHVLGAVWVTFQAGTQMVYDRIHKSDQGQEAMEVLDVNAAGSPCSTESTKSMIVRVQLRRLLVLLFWQLLSLTSQCSV